MTLPATLDALEKFRYEFVSFAAERLKELLENKHLYQKVSIPSDKNQATRNFKMMFGSNEGMIGDFDGLVTRFVDGRFTIAAERQFKEPGHVPLLCLLVGNVKLFCSRCEAREAFRPIWFSDITNELLGLRKNSAEKFKIAFGNTFQLFSLVFQCQRCEGLPETFLVKRDGLDLVLEGRSPIEHIELHGFIPKDEKHWFRDAVIAFQTGKVLAALFYLRTFIEQFARRKTGTQNDKKTGDDILTAYATTIPENIRETMPSLKEWYDKLSAALHGANEDSELFESAREKIEEHFDIRRVHKLDSKVAVATKEADSKTAG